MEDEGYVQRGYRITGRVQGVYYRAWTRGVANELGLRGSVRNRTDGSVEAHVVGSAGAVGVFETKLWEGPAAAAVDGIESLASSESLPSGSFEILETT